MIGIVVVSHGQVAVELVNAARTIVGDIPAIAAVSIGWSDDVAIAHDAILKAMEEVGEGDTLILTDMFGGTPTNVSLPFLSARVEIVTGVNLPMLIKVSSLREGDLLEVARAIRDQGRGAISVATEVLGRRPA
ncbi:MAG: PTS sugar transporter subunit IIA [Vicinamibacteria bacterium]